MTSERIPWIDMAKGLGIILVVTIHATGDRSFRALLESVAIPSFMFLSGFLFKGAAYADWQKFLFKRIRTRLFPYVLWVVISYLIVMVMNSGSAGEYASYLSRMTTVDFLAGTARADFDWLNGTVQNGPLWFLPCLFLVEILFCCVGGSSSALKISVFLAAFSLGTVLLHLSLTWRVPFILNMAMTNVLFFGAGLLFKKTRGGIDLPLRKMSMLLLGTLACVLFVAGGSGLQTRPVLSFWGIYYQYAISFLGIMVLLIVARFGQPIAPIRYLGSNTLIILLLNEPLRKATVALFSFVSFSFFDNLFNVYREIFTLFQVCAVLVLAVPCIALIKWKLPFLIGSFTLATKHTD